MWQSRVETEHYSIVILTILLHSKYYSADLPLRAGLIHADLPLRAGLIHADLPLRAGLIHAAYM